MTLLPRRRFLTTTANGIGLVALASQLRAAWGALAHANMNLDEFITRE